MCLQFASSLPLEWAEKAVSCVPVVKWYWPDLNIANRRRTGLWVLENGLSRDRLFKISLRVKLTSTVSRWPKENYVPTLGPRAFSAFLRNTVDRDKEKQQPLLFWLSGTILCFALRGLAAAQKNYSCCGWVSELVIVVLFRRCWVLASTWRLEGKQNNDKKRFSQPWHVWNFTVLLGRLCWSALLGHRKQPKLYYLYLPVGIYQENLWSLEVFVLNRTEYTIWIARLYA